MQNYWNLYLACKQQQLYGPVNYSDLRETGPRALERGWVPLWPLITCKHSSQAIEAPQCGIWGKEVLMFHLGSFGSRKLLAEVRTKTKISPDFSWYSILSECINEIFMRASNHLRQGKAMMWLQRQPIDPIYQTKNILLTCWLKDWVLHSIRITWVLTLSEFSDYANISRDFHLSSSYWVCVAISLPSP